VFLNRAKHGIRRPVPSFLDMIPSYALFITTVPVVFRYLS
jgi:hypothetical protein